MVYTYNGKLLSHKKEWNNTICNNIDEPRDYHTKWSKSEKERQIPYDIAYMWNLKYDTNVLTYKTQTHRHEKTCFWRGRVRVEMMDWAFRTSRCKLLYIEWINNKVLWCSTGNCIKYPVINHNGKEKTK